ncbi:MAG TPA: DoxX family protein [Polyangiaceae bacterium]
MTFPADNSDHVADLSSLISVPPAGEIEHGSGGSLLARWARATPWAYDLAFLGLRLAFGSTLALSHGLGKLEAPARFIQGLTNRGFPLPELFGWAALLSEFVGGLLLALGLFTRPAAALVLITLTVAALDIHSGDPFAKRELALAYAVVALTLLIAGPGRLSLDRPPAPASKAGAA